MRVLVVVIAVCSVSELAGACPSPSPYARFEAPLLPARPRIFVQGDLPRVTQDGAPVSYTHEVVDRVNNISQLDLEVTQGALRVEYAQYSESFWIVPSMRPVTHSLTRELFTAERSFDFEAQYSFDIDSDAAAFRIDNEIVFNEHSPMYPPHNPRRIVALYADRTEEIIFERDPIGRERALVLLGVLLSALTLLTWFVSVGPASPREVRA